MTVCFRYLPLEEALSLELEQGGTQGGEGGVQVNPPFIKLIIFIAWLGMHV